MADEAIQSFEWWNAAAILAAAFLGPYFAYKLERMHRRREARTLQIFAAKRTITALAEMLSVVIQYRNEIVAPYVGQPDFWLNMHTSNIASWETTKFDGDGMAYLLDTTEANLFLELQLEQRRSDDFQNLISRRDEIMLCRVFPALGQVIQPGGQIDQNTFVEKLGHHTEHELRILTESIMNRADSLLTTLENAHDKLGDAIAKIHPEKMFFKFVPFS